MNDKQGEDQEVSPSTDDKAEEPKTVDNVSEQLEKLNVGAVSDESQLSETQSGGDTTVTATLS